MKFILGIILILFISLLVVGFLGKTNKNNPILPQSISETPVPFPEMTIPYLRSKSYKSSLGQMQEYQEYDTYTSYLTSYLSDGLKVNALLTIPKSDEENKKFPAIVFIHGYIPPTQYVTTERYVDYVDYLARNGFVVMKIDLRGHGDSEGRPGGGYFGSDYVVDALNAYAALQSAQFVDPKKVGMWGHSMAGNIVMRSFAVKPEIPAVVIWAGAVYSYEDQRKYGINDQSYRPPEQQSQQQNRRRELYEKVGSPSASSPFWRMVAPVYYLNDLKGAIEIHHAEDDTVVNIGYSRDLMALLDKTSVHHEFYTYTTGGHNISGESFSLAMQRTVEFFRKYLK
jgi:dipeptidyl aminopeptidase/acylaminoacyl peptidase